MSENVATGQEVNLLDSSKDKLVQSVLLYSKHQSFQQIYTPPLHKKTSSNLNSLIRQKASIYATCKPAQSRLTPILESLIKQNKKTSKLITSSIDFPRIRKLDDLVKKQRQLYHIYREKMEFNYDQCLLFYMDVILAAVKYEFQISSQVINLQGSLLIQCFLFVAASLLEIGLEKLAIYFCVKGIRLCQVYRRNEELGQMLFFIGCAARKLQKFDDSILFFKKGLEYFWKNRNKQSEQKQIQTYNQLSQCLLQINRAEQSKIFAYKYQIGYLQKSDSKIIELSNQLTNSVQMRKSKWHAVSYESMELLLQFDFEDFMRKNSGYLIKMDQKRVIELMKINFQFLYDNFLQDDMFFYQIPMPLEVASEIQRPLKKKPIEGVKFMVKKRSLSVGNLKAQPVAKLVKIQPFKPKQFLIFNYRGVGVSKQKLSNLFIELVRKITLTKNLKKQEKQQTEKQK